MADLNPTVADWLAWGEPTIVVHCDALACGHSAIVRIDKLDPRLTRADICRRARCAACGHRGGTVMRDMAAHDATLQVNGWSGRPSLAQQAPRKPDDTAPL